MASTDDPVVTFATSGQTQRHIRRIIKDIRDFKIQNSESMYVFADEKDLETVHALIRGPEKTPYHNGFFYFVFKFPKNYPLQPPEVKLITTGGQTVRFNPNLYSCGKVCLSILGTWEGPGWTAVQTLFSVMLSIQSLMNEKPYHNEPGYEEENCKSRKRTKMADNVQNYNEMITHETIRVAVIEMLDPNSVDARNMPQELKNVMISFFRNNYRFYEDVIHNQMHLNGQPIVDPFRERNRPKEFQYEILLKRLQNLKRLHGISDNPNASVSKISKPLVSKSVAVKMKSENVSQPLASKKKKVEFIDLTESDNCDEEDDEDKKEESAQKY